MLRPLLIAVLAAGTLASPTVARQATPPAKPAIELGQETSIPLLRYRGLYDFEADSDRGVWLQDQSRHWYYARIAGLCLGLPQANRIAVDTRFGGGSFDRTGRLLVDGERCFVDSVTTSAGPPRKGAKKG